MEITRKAKVITVVGARPNFMKAAPIIAAIRDHNDSLAMSPSFTSFGHSPIAIESVLVHIDTIGMLMIVKHNFRRRQARAA